MGSNLHTKHRNVLPTAPAQIEQAGRPFQRRNSWAESIIAGSHNFDGSSPSCATFAEIVQTPVPSSAVSSRKYGSDQESQESREASAIGGPHVPYQLMRLPHCTTLQPCLHRIPRQLKGTGILDHQTELCSQKIGPWLRHGLDAQMCRNSKKREPGMSSKALQITQPTRDVCCCSARSTRAWAACHRSPASRCSRKPQVVSRKAPPSFCKSSGR